MMINFQEIIGVEQSNDLYKQFENEIGVPAIKRENNISTNDSYVYELLYKEKGILVTFLENKVVKIKVFFSPTPICQPFRGEFVLGLSYISSENDIKKQFDFPQNLNQAPMRADNIYEFQNCTVAFDAMTAEINYAEIK